MSSTAQTNFGSLLLNPKSLNVNGTIYDNEDLATGINNATLLNAIKQVNDARTDFSKPKQVSGKSQILDMINQVSQKTRRR